MAWPTERLKSPSLAPVHIHLPRESQMTLDISRLHSSAPSPLPTDERGVWGLYLASLTSLTSLRPHRRTSPLATTVIQQPSATWALFTTKCRTGLWPGSQSSICFSSRQRRRTDMSMSRRRVSDPRHAFLRPPCSRLRILTRHSAGVEGTFHVVDPHTVWYEDLTGSGT